ncbi:hypothetical protein CBS147354_8546 [Penicillium roqueforti]|nr:hypothetical protein CBS147354_8546 [Penicillium roqueforti]
MNAIEQSPASNALAQLTRVPIAQLSPDLEKLAEKSFLAAVALVWPYSSSIKTVSLLLAEPDFRLRGARGQIKVTFHGRVAERVAESHVGIGDTVSLALKDIKFVSNEDAQKTPGRSVAWDAHFENGVSLEIYRSSQPPLIISVEPQVTAPHETEPASPTTPSGKSINPEFDLPSSERPWGSPMFLNSTRTPLGGTIRSAFDPFTEEDGFVPGKGRKKPRYSLHREDWRVVNEPESPREQEAPVDWEQALNQSIDQELEADSASEASMTDDVEAPTYTEDAPQEPLPVFAKPSLELTGSILERHAAESNVVSHGQVDDHETLFHLPTDTPQIRPIPSPGLPIPSPLVSNHAGSTSYFLPWTAPTQFQEIGYAQAGMDTIATPAASSIETHDTDTIDSIHADLETVDPDVESVQQEHVFDAGFIRNDSASYPGSEDLPEKQGVEIIDSIAIDGSDVVEADMAIDTTGDKAQMSNELEQYSAFDDPNLSHDHPARLSDSEDKWDDSPNTKDESPAAQADVVTENATDEAQASDETYQEHLVDSSHLWRDNSGSSSPSEEAGQDESLESSEEVDGSDIAQHDLGIETASDNLGSPQYPGESRDEKHPEPETHLVHYPQLGLTSDQDAIDALGKMIAARDEEYQKMKNTEEEKESEKDVDRPPSQGYREEKDEEVYYAESVENYDSQCESEEDEEDLYGDPSLESRLDEDDFGVVESSGEKPEQEQKLPSQAGSHEVIVLDSDSDDESASNHPVASASQSAERNDHSYCSESEHPAVPPAAAEFASGVQEYPEPWYLDGKDYHGVVEDDSDTDERQSEDSEESEDIERSEYGGESEDREAREDREDREDEEEGEDEYNQQYDRVYESDMDDDESSQDHYETDRASEVASPNLEQDEDKQIKHAELIEEADNDEYYTVANPHAQIGVPVDRDYNEGQSGNADPNLLDGPESHHQGPSLEGKNHAGQYLTGDGQFDLHIPSSARNTIADFPLKHEPTVEEPTVEGPEPLGGRVSPSTTSPLKRQPSTSDPTQKNASPLELIHDFEHQASSTIEETEAPTGLDKTLLLADSPVSDQDDGIGAGLIKNTQEIHVDRHDDAVAPSESVEAAEPTATPEPGRSMDVVIESPNTLAVPIPQPSVPDRNASGLRSELSYFAPLATLIDHYNALVDTISIVHEASPITRAKSSPKDWFVTIELTDPSMAGMTLHAQIFRRHKASMPTLVEGNAILLRDFKVQSFDHTMMLVSADTSAWAVFDGSGPEAETNGPPVEYDSQERAYASGLRRWYDEIGSARVADHMLQAAIERDREERDMTPGSQVRSESGTPDSKRGSQRKRKSTRRITIHELRDGTRYTEVGSPNSRNSSVHELRDGTLYANI